MGSDELVLVCSHPSTSHAHMYMKSVSLLPPIIFKNFSYFLLRLGLVSTGAWN